MKRSCRELWLFKVASLKVTKSRFPPVLLYTGVSFYCDDDGFLNKYLVDFVRTFLQRFAASTWGVILLYF